MRLSSTNMLCFEFFLVLSELNTPVCKAHAAACVNASDSSGSGENLTRSKNSLCVVTKLVSSPKILLIVLLHQLKVQNWQG